MRTDPVQTTAGDGGLMVASGTMPFLCPQYKDSGVFLQLQIGCLQRWG